MTEHTDERRRKKETSEDFELYEAGKEYNRTIGYYENAKKNERFYRGDQWYGVESADLPTPVFNVFKRVINYFVSTIMSQKISVKYSAEGLYAMGTLSDKEKTDKTCKLLSDYINYRFEKDKISALFTKGIFDAAITGDCFLYTYWDPSKRTCQGFSGDFVTTLYDGANVFFGDVNSNDTEEQPYILLSGRELVTRLRREARENGASREVITAITPDDDNLDEAGELSSEELKGTKCTYIIKLYKKNGTVHYRKSVRAGMICPEVDTGLTLYPVTLMNWEPVKNSYHGQAAATGLTENQIYINKAFAMVMKHMTDVSFSKVMYNENLIDEWTNGVGEAIAVNGPPENAVLRIDPGTMQSGFLDVISMTLSVTKELMGATDAALGNVAPENTSAIIALRQASNIPLETQKRALYDAAAHLGMVWLEFIMNYYDGARMLLYRNGNDSDLKSDTLDNALMRRLIFDCRVDVGASSYWSELAAVSTLDNLLKSGMISFEQYLERLPAGLIPEKEKLLREVREHTSKESSITGENAHDTADNMN
ncbi:MAG: hypothetical protein E7665_00405 [Ruminococcaceae bacterium]|nr:hypothetical protein [Oscillospiraceae bacterium]